MKLLNCEYRKHILEILTEAEDCVSFIDDDGKKHLDMEYKMNVPFGYIMKEFR